MPAAKLNILALDTVTEACSVALYARGAVEQRLETTANRHARRVLGMTQEALRAGGMDLRDLDALAVDVGPGSFTGARIGIGVAQGLAYAAGLPVVPVNSLEALAEAVLRPGDGLHRHPRNPPSRHPHNPPSRHPRSLLSGGGDSTGGGDGDAGAVILPAIDARMEQVYFALYGRAGEMAEPALAAPGDVGATLADAHAGGARLIGVGSGWQCYAPALREALATTAAAIKIMPGRHPEAASVAQIAAARGLQHAVSPLHLRARYIRVEVAARPAPGGGDD